MLMGTVCLNFYEPLSKCSPSGLNALQIYLTNARKKDRTHSGKLESLVKDLKMSLPYLELYSSMLKKIPTLMGIFFSGSQCLYFFLCCTVSKRLQGSLKGPRQRFLKPPSSSSTLG